VAIKYFAFAMRLSPLDPQIIGMQGGTAFVHFLASRYDEALSWAAKAMWAQTNYTTPLFVAAAGNALAGRLVEARAAMARLIELDPALRIPNVKNWIRLRRHQDLERFEDGLRKAGLPEM